MLGVALRRRFARADVPGGEVIWTDVRELDITDAGAVERFVRDRRPRVILNCAALTDVDGCEARRDEAFRVNGDGVRHLARAAAAAGSLLVQISTDFVFAGDADRPYREDDPTGPRCVYGRSKLAGEQAARTAPEHLIVRTAWLYGPGGRNFVRAICDRADAGEPLRVVGDQMGCPTSTHDLAEALVRLLTAGARGTVHACGGQRASWCEFARAIVDLRSPGLPVEEIRSADLKRPAARPAFSVLDCSRLQEWTGYQLPGFGESLPAYLAELPRAARKGP